VLIQINKVGHELVKRLKVKSVLIKLLNKLLFCSKLLTYLHILLYTNLT